MSHTFIVCRCWNCARASEFPVEILGRESRCRHCKSRLRVLDESSREAGDDDSIVWWLEFTESGNRMSPEFSLPEKLLPR